MKQRLVGILVFSCLLLLAWHLVFSNTEVAPLSMHSEIPAAPPVSRPQTKAPQKPVFTPRPQAVPEARPATSVVPSPALAAEPAIAPSETMKAGAGNEKDVSKEPASTPLASAETAASTHSDTQTTAKSTRVKTPSAIQPAPSTPPQRDRQTGLPVAWVVQVITLAEKSAAEDLKRALKKDAYKAYTKTLQRDGKTLYRVCIGPKLSKDAAEKLRSEVGRRYKRFDPIIVRFER